MAKKTDFSVKEQSGNMIKEYEHKNLTEREHERAQVRKNMRRWVKLRERFDKRSLNKNKSG